MAKKSTKAYEPVYTKELRTKAKRANQRMVRLEKAALTGSPAYKAVQTQLELMGRTAKTAAGRRFSETGITVDQNEARRQLAILNRFLSAETSTVSGEKAFRKRVYESADKEMNLKESGITQTDYEQLWEALPDNERDRVYYASFYIETLQAYRMKRKSGAMENEHIYSVQELVDVLDSSKSYKDALRSLGLTVADINKVRAL